MALTLSVAITLGVGASLRPLGANTIAKRLLETSRHSIVSGLIGLAGSLYPGRALEVREVEPISRLLGKLLGELKLRPAVSLPEGVNVIHVTDRASQLHGERL